MSSRLPSINSPTKDPSLPATINLPAIPTTSRARDPSEEKLPFHRKFATLVYNDGKYCGRSCLSWFYIIAYSFMYLLLLTAYTLICLFVTLWILKLTMDFSERTERLTYSSNSIGLTATPTSENLNYPLIWYRKGQPKEYEKYIRALDHLLVRTRRKRDVDVLGPCGEPPYGYGDKPCVLIRVNKQFHWAGKPLLVNSTETKIAPTEVQNWLKRDKKLWVHCSGHHSYDKEHVGRIRYYPDPPGVDPGLFPLLKGESPVVAIQLSNFTVGLSLSIECKFWYIDGPSSVHFMLYVALEEKGLGRSP